MLATLLQQLGEDPVPIDGVNIAWSALAPMLVLVGGALLILVADSLWPRRPPAGSFAAFAVFTAGLSVISAIPLWQRVQPLRR